MPPKKNNDDAFSDNAQKVKAWIEANISAKGKAKTVINKTYSTDGKKHTMLYRACRLGRFEVAKMLIEDYGTDVNIKNGGDDKSVPLHGACYGGSPPCVALLVCSGADVDAKNSHGETPLENAKSPADDVKKAFATKCQKLLKDPAACSEQLKIANANVAKIGEINSASSTTAVIGSKTSAPTAEAADEKKPAKKMAKKEVAVVPTGPHPLHGKTIVLGGKLEKSFDEHQAAASAVGVKKVTRTLCSKADYFVAAKTAGHKAFDAVRQGIIIWTEAQFEAVCKDGWSAVPPPKLLHAALKCLVDTTKLEESYRTALISLLAHLFHPIPNVPIKTHLCFQWPIPNKGTAPTVGSFGADLIAPIVAHCPVGMLSLDDNDLTDKDVTVVMEAIAARGDDIPAITYLAMRDNNGITDEGAITIAKRLPKTRLDSVSLCNSTGITKRGVAALLEALAKAPLMQSLDITGISGAKEAHQEWKVGSGQGSTVDVRTEVNA